MNIVIRAIILSLLVFNSVSARFAQKEDCAIEYDFYNRDIEINKDGTSTEVVELQYTLLNESGRDHAGTYSYMYNNESQKFKLLAAYTIIDGKKVKVQSKMIEDKPYGPSLSGFDSYNRVVIAYPQAEVGSKLYLKYQLKTTQPILKGFYDIVSYWGMAGFWNKSKVIINSKLPLHMISNDPYDALDIKISHKNGGSIITAELKKPVCLDTLNENYSILSDNKKLWVKISTLDDHNKFIKSIAPRYEEVIASELPDQYNIILEEARKISNEVHQINHVTSKINEIVRYMGDWRTIKGGFYPRKLEVIVKTGFGDCKDFSVSTAAILDRLGYKANVVLVSRGEGMSKVEKFLPGHIHNHAMIRAVSPSGREFFIDPTNFVSMADGIFPDIANKSIYILDSKNPKMTKTPNVDYKHSKKTYNEIGETKNGNLFVKGDRKYIGEYVIGLTGVELQTSRKNIEDWIINNISGDTECLEKKLIFPELKSRIVKDITVKYEYKKIDSSTKTSLGRVFDSSIPGVATILTSITDDRESDIYIDSPHTYYGKTIIKNANRDQLHKLNFKRKMPFMNIERKVYAHAGNDVAIEHKIELIRGYISSEEFRSDEFKKLRDDLKKEMKIGVIIQ